MLAARTATYTCKRMCCLTQIKRLEAKSIRISREPVPAAGALLMPSSAEKDPASVLHLVREVLRSAPLQVGMLQVSCRYGRIDLLATGSERQGRAIDKGQSASMEDKKQEGYF